MYSQFINSDGTHFFMLNGKLHREDGPAVDGPSNKEWWLYGKRHRVNGPAVDGEFQKEWWYNDYLHREDGPAIILASGKIFYFLNGKEISSDKEFERIINLKLFW